MPAPCQIGYGVSLKSVSMLKQCVIVGLLVVSGLIAGCGPDTSNISKPTEVVSWPALKSLNDPSVTMGIYMPSQMGDFAGCRKNASDPKLNELVTAFESEAIPDQYKSPAREEAKQKVVTAYKAIIANAKSNGSNDELKKSIDTVKTGMASLIDPNLK